MNTHPTPHTMPAVLQRMRVARRDLAQAQVQNAQDALRGQEQVLAQALNEHAGAQAQRLELLAGRGPGASGPWRAAALLAIDALVYRAHTRIAPAEAAAAQARDAVQERRLALQAAERALLRNEQWQALERTQLLQAQERTEQDSQDEFAMSRHGAVPARETRLAGASP